MLDTGLKPDQLHMINAKNEWVRVIKFKCSITKGPGKSLPSDKKMGGISATKKGLGVWILFSSYLSIMDHFQVMLWQSHGFKD